MMEAYHLWTIAGLYNYVLYSGDIEFIEDHWSNYENSIAYTKSLLLGDKGIVNATGQDDWGRITGSPERCSISSL